MPLDIHMAQLPSVSSMMRFCFWGMDQYQSATSGGFSYFPRFHPPFVNFLLHGRRVFGRVNAKPVKAGEE